MKIGVGLDGRLRLSSTQLLGLGKDATLAGFESMWTPASSVPDAFHLCAGWSRESQTTIGISVQTGIAVVPAPRLWKPESLASQAATVGELTNGKFILGIGTGGFCGQDLAHTRSS